MNALRNDSDADFSLLAPILDEVVNELDERIGPPSCGISGGGNSAGLILSKAVWTRSAWRFKVGQWLVDRSKMAIFLPWRFCWYCKLRSHVRNKSNSRSATSSSRPFMKLPHPCCKAVMNVWPVSRRTNFNGTHSSTNTLTDAPFPELMLARPQSQPRRFPASLTGNSLKTPQAGSCFPSVQKAMPRGRGCREKPDHRPIYPGRRGCGHSARRALLFQLKAVSFVPVVTCATLAAP